jgi:RNA polymerase sigma-70 factor (ECF subfamily)
MSPTSYHPSDAYLPTARVLLKERPITAGTQASKPRNSQSSSRSIRLDSKFICTECDVSEDELITSAQRGDDQAFVELYRRHSTATKKKIYAIVRNQEDAEDAFQDTLLRAYKHLSSFRRSCKFSTWLTRIGINSALMIMRKRRVHRETYQGENCPNDATVERQEPVDRSPGPEGIFLKQQNVLLVRREVEKLRPRLRSVVNHYYRSDCTLAEAAKAQEISLAAAKSRLTRGKATLRSSLARYGIITAHN